MQLTIANLEDIRSRLPTHPVPIGEKFRVREAFTPGDESDVETITGELVFELKVTRHGRRWVALVEVAL